MTRPGDRHLRPPVSVRLPADVLAELDAARGAQPRNAVILAAVRAYLVELAQPGSGAPHAPLGAPLD